MKIHIDMKTVWCAALAVLLNSSQADVTRIADSEILVTTREGSFRSVLDSVHGWGIVRAQDPDSGLYRVRLNPGIDQIRTKRALSKSGRYRLVLNGDQTFVNRLSDDSVTDHLRYLQEVERHLEKSGKSIKHGGESLDWWGAYQHWLHDHANKDGFYRASDFTIGADVRDQLPAAHLGGNHQAFLGGNWTYVGPHNEQPVPGRLFDGLGPLSGRVNGIAVDPKNSSNVFICTATGGVWKSQDRGATWAPLSDNWKLMQTTSVCIDPRNPNIVYVGTGDFPGTTAGFGVMKSLDGGTTWTNYGSTTLAGLAISRIMVDPANSAIVIAAAGRGDGSNAGGVFRSTDSGQTWARTNAPTTSWDGLSVSLVDKFGRQTFWAAGEAATGAYIYSSVNDGSTWTKVQTPIPARAHSSVDVACSKLAAGTVYVLDPNNPNSQATQNSGNHIWKTTNNGSSWTDVIPGFVNGDGTTSGGFSNWNQDSYNFYIGTSVISNGPISTDGVYVGLITIAMSDNGGASWRDLSKSQQSNNKALSHCDEHAFFADPVSPNTVYFGNDGGVHRMVYDPLRHVGSFSPLNLYLYATQWYFAAVHPTDPTRVMGGLQDNANPASVGDLSNWINPGAGDGSAVSYDPYDPRIAYNCTQDLAVSRTTDGWLTTNDITDQSSPPYNGEKPNFLPIIVTATKGTGPSLLYAGTDHLWSWDPTNLWVGDLSGSALCGSGSNIRTIAPCPSDRTRLYTGSDDGQLWKVTKLNLGVNAVSTEIDGGFAGNSAVVTIAPLPANSGDILAGISGGAGGPHLFRCAKVDTGSPVWTSVSGTGSGSLPNVNVNSVVRDPASPLTTWYVGTDVGVFMTVNSGASWTNMTRPLGLPNVGVNSLVANATTGFLYAGTYGRGLWKIALQSAALSSLVLIPSTVIGGIDNSVGTVTLTGSSPSPIVVTLTSSDPLSATVPTSVTIPAGQTKATFTIVTYQPLKTGEKITITAATAGVSKTAILTLN